MFFRCSLIHILWCYLTRILETLSNKCIIVLSRRCTPSTHIYIIVSSLMYIWFLRYYTKYAFLYLLLSFKHLLKYVSVGNIKVIRVIKFNWFSLEYYFGIENIFISNASHVLVSCNVVYMNLVRNKKQGCPHFSNQNSLQVQILWKKKRDKIIIDIFKIYRNNQKLCWKNNL